MMYLHICPVCEHRNSRGSRFCNECGAPLQLRFCPACHAAADVLDLKCPACGVNLPQVALSEAADLPPEFTESLSRESQPPDPSSAPSLAPPVGEAKETPPMAAMPVRESAPQTTPEPERASAHRERMAAAGDPLDPLTGPNFGPFGDTHTDAHGEGHGHADESAARFAAAKTASIIERLYGKSASPAGHQQAPASAPAPSDAAAAVRLDDASQPQADASLPSWAQAAALTRAKSQARKKDNVLITGALMLFGFAAIGLFFAVTSDPPPRQLAAPPASAPLPETPSAPGAGAASAPGTGESTLPATTFSRQFEGTIRSQRETMDNAATPAAGDAPRDPSPAASAPGTGPSGTTTPPVARAAEPSPTRAAAQASAPSKSRAPVTTQRPAPSTPPRQPAQATPCTPQVAALGLCTLAD
jgi:hypothetical protein